MVRLFTSTSVDAERHLDRSNLAVDKDGCPVLVCFVIYRVRVFLRTRPGSACDVSHTFYRACVGVPERKTNWKLLCNDGTKLEIVSVQEHTNNL